jgi:hypothetical protein
VEKPTDSPLRPGDQLASTVCSARVVVVRAPSGARPVIACGGSPMVAANGVPRPPAPRPSSSAGGEHAEPAEPATLIGKRYVDADETLELLCVSSGSGALSFEGAPMQVKAAKPLPASD